MAGFDVEHPGRQDRDGVERGRKTTLPAGRRIGTPRAASGGGLGDARPSGQDWSAAALIVGELGQSNCGAKRTVKGASAATARRHSAPV